MHTLVAAGVVIINITISNSNSIIIVIVTIMIIIGVVIPENMAIITRHFGLHCMEHIVTNCWNSLNADQQLFLREQVS